MMGAWPHSTWLRGAGRWRGRAVSAHYLRPRGGHSQSGFTLIETLVALAIFASLIGALYTGMSDNWRNARRADMDVAAMRLGKTQLALAGRTAPLAAGPVASGRDQGIDWTVSAEPYAGAEEQATAPAAWWLVFDAAWADGRIGTTRSFRLRSLRLAEPQ